MSRTNFMLSSTEHEKKISYLFAEKISCSAELSIKNVLYYNLRARWFVDVCVFIFRFSIRIMLMDIWPGNIWDIMWDILLTCVPSEDSDHSVLPCSLIKVFVVCMKKLCIFGYPKYIPVKILIRLSKCAGLSEPSLCTCPKKINLTLQLYNFLSVLQFSV